uniref:F-box associated domain-containing protein n=1 Tax=Oryza glumipatula TaxID=40148 RepID=A0A0E0B9W1_9ORYZ
MKGRAPPPVEPDARGSDRSNTTILDRVRLDGGVGLGLYWTINGRKEVEQVDIICRAWRAIVDDRCPPPHPNLLRLSLADIFFASLSFYYTVEDLPGFFARWRRNHHARISHKLDYLDDAPIHQLEAIDHCNSLFLMQEYIVNPATRRWARLPPTPEWSPAAMVANSCPEEYLVYDPTVSPHYEVLSIHHLDDCFRTNSTTAESVVWPPSPFVVQVYSSATGRWEKRSLVRRGEATGTITDVQDSHGMATNHLYGVYWRGALYVQMRNNDYQVIKSPSDINMNNNPYIYLGRSMKGVYCASIDLKQHQRLQVWLLHELHGGGYHMEWMLIHDFSLNQIMADFRWNPEAVRPWIEHDMYCDDAKNDIEISQAESTGWD